MILFWAGRPLKVSSHGFAILLLFSFLFGSIFPLSFSPILAQDFMFRVDHLGNVFIREYLSFVQLIHETKKIVAFNST